MLDIANSKYLDDCYTELERKQAQLIEEYKLDSYGGFDYNMEKGTIEFKNGSIVMLTANFIPVGSFSEEQQSWMWAWANNGVTGEINEKAESIKVLEDKIGNEIFSAETFAADESAAWELAALACDHYQGQGVFAAPIADLLIFMVLSDVALVQA